jgi:hypothetical protein
MIDRRACLFVLILAVPALARQAHAQLRLEVGPTLGHYRPVGSFDSTEVTSVTLPARPRDAAGTALGIESRLWRGRVGFGLLFARARSEVPPALPPGGPLGPTSVRVSFFAAQVALEVTGSSRTRFWIGGGAGAVRHGGEAYSRFDSMTDLAGTLTGGASIVIYGPLRIGVTLTTFLYSFEVGDSAAGTLQRGFQIDPLGNLGVILMLP